MGEIPNVFVLCEELRVYYPNEMNKAITYLEIEYELNTLNAIQLAGIVWSSLHLNNPLNLPTFLINPLALYKN